MIKLICPKELILGNNLYSCSFCKEINSGRLSYVPETCQHYLLYLQLRLKLFLFGRVGVLSLHGQFFGPGLWYLTHVNLIFKHFFLLKYASSFPSHVLLYVSHDLHFSATIIFVIDLCSSLKKLCGRQF